MLKVSVSYGLDGAEIAEQIIKELSDKEVPWKIEHSPSPGNGGNPAFWSALRLGRLETDVVIFIVTSGYFKKHLGEIESLNNTTPEYARYRFVWLILDTGLSLPLTAPCDLKIETETPKSPIYMDAKGKELLLQIADYLRAISIVTEKNKLYEKERHEKSRRMLNMLIPIITVYMGILITTAIIAFVRDEFAYSSSWFITNDFVFIITAMLGIFSVAYAMLFLMRNRQRQEKIREEKDFGKEIDSSLSSVTDKDYENVLYKMLLMAKAKDDTVTTKSIKELESTSRSKDNTATEITQALGTKEYSLFGHLKFNIKQMKGYYDISKGQATTSFRWAITFSILGFALLVFAVLSPLIPQFTAENSLIPIIGIISGAVVELLAGTIFFIYKRSLAQMNIYHEALSNYQTYLSCVNLATQFDEKKKKDEMFERIIEKELERGFFIKAEKPTKPKAGEVK
ncbi:MAG: MMPL family transporter [Oscillospiraceae bacterium]|nr:MMPL family transporter [Oscillospiraceae bacterium]